MKTTTTIRNEWSQALNEAVTTGNARQWEQDEYTPLAALVGALVQKLPDIARTLLEAPDHWSWDDAQLTLQWEGAQGDASFVIQPEAPGAVLGELRAELDVSRGGASVWQWRGVWGVGPDDFCFEGEIIPPSPWPSQDQLQTFAAHVATLKAPEQKT